MALRITGILALAAALGLASAARGAEGADASEAVKAAKAVVEKHKDAVVEVRLVLKIKQSFGGREGGTQEQKVEVNGTVIDPSGLTVISNMATDPTSRWSVDLGEDGPQFKMDTSVTDVKIVLADGKEYPGKVVLRDKDLDLAFVRPDEKGLKLACLELKAPPAEPKLLDEIIGLTRLDRSANREPAVGIGRLMAVIQKPRTHYVAMTIMDVGCPAFDAQGNLLGISVMRISGAKSSGGFSMMSMMPSVLPCADIQDAAKQVPAPGAEKKAETKPKTEEKPKAEAPKAEK
jgi:S1-C subfamily serine protease